MIEKLEVDVTNPGQVFACLGVLDILDRLDPGAVGRFAEETSFEIQAKARVHDAVAAIKNASLDAEAPADAIAPWGGDKAWPVVVSGDFGSFTLDPWLTPDHSTVATGLKLWAGQVSTPELLKGLQERLLLPEPNAAGPLFLLGVPGTPTGLDPRSAISKSDLGFSYNSQRLKPRIYPAVDLFAMIGLEGARPERTGGLTYAYSLWDKPLPPVVARAVLAGRVSALASSRWEYTIESRGLAGTYKNLSTGRPVEEGK
jgi:CRISPR-associated protein Csx14